MPVILIPPPQRLRLTRETVALPEAPLIRVDPAPEREARAALGTLKALFPEARTTRKLDVETPIQLDLVDAARLQDAGVPPEVAAQGYTLEVAPEAVALRASAPAGWQYGLLTLAQLLSEAGAAGAMVEDWPQFGVRGVRVPRPAAAFQPEFRERLLQNLSHWRWNAVTFAEDDPAWRPPEAGVRVVPAAEAPAPSARLLENPGLYPRFGRELPAVLEQARAAAAEGTREWWLDLGDWPEEMLLDVLWFGIGFAGACAWNPAKADLKQHRRSFASYFFGSRTSALPRAIQALESAEEALSGTEPGLSRALDRDDLFAPARVPVTLRLEERAAEAQRLAEAAMEGLDEAAVTVAANADAVQALRVTAQSIAELAERLVGLARARERYASAHVAESNARATSQRTLAAAEQLDALAGAMRARREEFARVWKRERTGPAPAPVGTELDARATALVDRAEAVRDSRNRYIQTGILTPPAEAGLALASGKVERSLLPERRALRSVPVWWPEGGAARMRVELEGDAYGIPWEILLDLRAHAGESGAFNIRSARMAVLDEDDAVTDLIPVQLTRRGFVFTPRPGQRAYHLYLDPEPAADGAERLTRARQSREGVRIETPAFSARLDDRGALVALALNGPHAEELRGPSPDEPILHFAGRALSDGARVRVIETGPLLARVLAETDEGFTVRYDCFGGLPAFEVSLNVPVPEVSARWSPGDWNEAAALSNRPDDATGLRWGALARPDGVAAALVTPAADAAYRAEDARQTLTSAGGLRYAALIAGRFARPEEALAGLAAAIAAPPRVLVGAVEERRVIEF